MPVDQEHTKSVFQKLNRQLTKLATKPQPKNVHQFRTNTRRLQALLEELAPELGRNEKKLLKLLMRLRRRAGRVRDLDVQIAALRSLKIPQEAARKGELLRTLAEMRAKREKKFIKSVDADTVRQLRKRLKRVARGLQIPNGAEPLALATRIFSRVTQGQSPLTEKILHSYRITGKRVRYVAELAGDVPEAKRMLEILKSMQDALGYWHDWLMLTQSAEELFGDAPDCALISALRNLTRAKFRHAMQVVTNTRALLLAKPAIAHRSGVSAELSGAGARRKPVPSSGDVGSAAVA